MRVLHVISSLDAKAGGPAAALLTLAAAQARAGLDVSILVTYRSGDDLSHAAALQDVKVRVEAVGPATGPLVRHKGLAPAVDRLVGASDVVHIHALWEEVQHLAARAAQGRGVPYVIRPCGMLTPWSLRQSRWKKAIYLRWRLRRHLARAAAMHYATDEEREQSTRALSLPARAIVEPNGLKLAEFEILPPAGSFRGQFPALAGVPLIVFLGRLHPGKGLEYLVPAMAQVRPAAAMLAVVGPDEGGFRESTLDGLLALHGVGNRVVFAGMLRGAARVAALADADLFCLPSDHENFGVAVAEAMAAGTPVVLSDQVAIHREVTAAGAGSAVGREPGLLAAELTRWLADEPLRRAAGARGRAFARERYDATRIATRWAGHYAALVAGKPKPAK